MQGELKYKDLTEKIIGVSFEVHKKNLYVNGCSFGTGIKLFLSI